MEGFYFNSTSQDQSFNHSNITNNQDYIKIPFSIKVVTYIIIAIGLPLTLVAICALYSMVRSDHVAPIYVINLLITDLLQFCYMIVEMAKPDNEIFGIFLYIYYCALFTSVYFMVCVALERYLVIAHPLWYRFRRTIKSSVAICVLVWAISPVCVFFYFIDFELIIIFAVLLLLPFPLFIFFLAGTLKALSASISVPSDEKRRIVGVLVLVLLIYTLLFLPMIISSLEVFDVNLSILASIIVRFSPLADLVLYVIMRKGTIDKLLASVCCCRMDSKDTSSPPV